MSGRSRWLWFLSVISSAYALSANCALAQFNNLGRLGNISGLDDSGIEAKKFFVGGLIFLNLLETSCNPGSKQSQSSFVITGRGGQPPNPLEMLTPDAVLVDWVTLNPSSDNRSTPSVTTKPTTDRPEPIVEATGWVINEKGEVILTADASTTAPHGSWQNPASCHNS